MTLRPSTDFAPACEQKVWRQAATPITVFLNLVTSVWNYFIRLNLPRWPGLVLWLFLGGILKSVLPSVNMRTTHKIELYCLNQFSDLFAPNYPFEPESIVFWVKHTTRHVPALYALIEERETQKFCIELRMIGRRIKYEISTPPNLVSTEKVKSLRNKQEGGAGIEKWQTSPGYVGIFWIPTVK